MSDLLGQRAVVVGGSIGGLAIAGTLTKYFECIEIFEHDRLKALPASRSGTPGSAPAWSARRPCCPRAGRARYAIRAAERWRTAKTGFRLIAAPHRDR